MKINGAKSKKSILNKARQEKVLFVLSTAALRSTLMSTGEN